MFRSREMSNVEKAMFEAGIDVRSGIGKYVLSKITEFGYANKFIDIALSQEWLSIISGQGTVLKEKEGAFLHAIEFGTFESKNEWFVAVWDFQKEEWIRYAYNYKSNTEKIVDMVPPKTNIESGSPYGDSASMNYYVLESSGLGLIIWFNKSE